MDGFKRPERSASQPVPPRPPQPDRSLPPVRRLPTPVPAVSPYQRPQPPRQLPTPPQSVNPEQAYSVPAPEPQPLEGMPLVLTEPAATPKRRHSRWRKLLLVTIATLIILVGLAGAAAVWFREQLRPVDPSDTSVQKVEVKAASSFRSVATMLEQRRIVRNAAAFETYAELQGKRSGLKEGTCKLTRAETADEILAKLTSGCHDFVSVTFYPGATIEKPLYKPADAVLDQTMYVKYRLAKAGFSEEQIAAALGKTYSGPLFADKPAGTSLEGYVFGETYYVDEGATAEQVLQTAFDQMYSDIQKNDISAKFNQQGLNLYQGITLASIVQRELNCEDKPTPERKDRCYQYQRTIAQIFLKRLRAGVSLGSDVTFIYAADMKGVAPTVNIDSPYNTRIHPGLPPGPIASPGLLALKAVADPTPTDYMFFIAGDDGLIYFATDQAGHEANIKNHCQKLCSEL